MALPLFYSEQTLAEFIQFQLGDVATLLGWAVEDASYEEIINQTLADYGEDDVTAITGRVNLLKLRTIAEYHAWQAVVKALTSKYDYSLNAERFDFEGIRKHARSMAQASAQAAAPYGIGPNVIRVQRVVRPQDPYRYYPEELRIAP